MRNALLLSFVMMTGALPAADALPCPPPAHVVVAWQGHDSGCTPFNGLECHHGEVIAFSVAAFGQPLTACSLIEWNFGDGVTAHGRQVHHRYALAGVYPITVRVSNQMGAITVEDQVFATGVIDEHFPFVAERTAKPNVYRFIIDTAQGSGDWIWDFGDGTSARGPERVRTHVYRTGGAFSVVLSSARGAGIYKWTIIVPHARRRVTRH
jgi:hypothetical protein